MQALERESLKVTDGGRRALFVGESWMSYGIHQKGFTAYTTGFYETGGDELLGALRGAGWEVEELPSHLATEQFPDTIESLATRDVLVLSDVGADTLLLHPDAFLRGKRTPNRLKVVCDWVHGGGSLLMVGGYMSFSGFEAKAGYARSPLARCLPVTVRETDDRVEAPEGVTPSVVLPEHPILAGVPADWPHFLGYNRIAAKPEAEVVMTFEEDPLLVVWQYGDGRVAAFASDCSPHWGSPEFMAWSGYALFWDAVLSWLAAEERA